MPGTMAKRKGAELINPDDYATVTEAAEQLGVDRSRVVQFIAAERLPARKIFGVTVVLREDLDRLRDRRPGRPRPPASREPPAKSGRPPNARKR